MHSIDIRMDIILDVVFTKGRKILGYIMTVYKDMKEIDSVSPILSTSCLKRLRIVMYKHVHKSKFVILILR